jgi:hypothetical protein
MREFKYKKSKRKSAKIKNKKKFNTIHPRKKTEKRLIQYPNEVKSLNCSPEVDGKTVTKSSCLTGDVIRKIKKAYNDKHPHSLILSNNSLEIWNTLNERLLKEKGCKNEKCWLSGLQNEKLKKEIEMRFFAPEQPSEWKSNPHEWLSNIDIFNVLTQYQEKYPHFKFIGPTTIDFDKRLPERNGNCVENELCNFNLKKDISQGIESFACVFNLDESWQSGSHWVSIFINVPEKIIFFFDSGGAFDTSIEITNLVERIKAQGMNLTPKINFKYYSNTENQHQTGETECGMYSIFFIITMLTGKTPFYKDRLLSMKERIDLFLKKKIPDEVVFDYRDLYFNVTDE